MVSFCLIWWPFGNPGKGQFRSLQNHALALLKDRSLSFVFVMSQLSKRLIISSVGVTSALVGSISESHFSTLLLTHPVLSSQTSIICPNATARGQQTDQQKFSSCVYEMQLATANSRHKQFLNTFFQNPTLRTYFYYQERDIRSRAEALLKNRLYS